MTDAAAIAGNYSDFRLVKSRSVAQVIVEVPIERAEAFLKAFGVPQPGAERPVALALLNVQKPAEQAVERERQKKPFHEMSRAQQAGILCADERFQKWLSVYGQHNPEEAARDEVCRICKVQSRKMLDHVGWSGGQWDALVVKYRQAVGLETERR